MAARNRNEVQQYVLIPLDKIKIVDRPKKGKEHEQLFYNVRSLKSFTPESMADLLSSIRTDELLEPLVVRLKNGVYELLAGERRLRSILNAYENDLVCYDPKGNRPQKWRPNTVVLYLGFFAKVKSHTKDGVTIEIIDDNGEPTEEKVVAAEELAPTSSAKKVYNKGVPCKVIENCSDQKALRINMAENDKSQRLTTAEEIEAVERLVRMGLKQDQIVYATSTNVTWVSQTASFRRELPDEVFQRLVDGKMTRNVGVSFLSYKAEDRQPLFESTVKVEEQETAEKIRKHQLEQEQAEDEAEILEDAAEKADDPKVASQTQRKAAAAKKKADKARQKKEKAESEEGHIKQGHVQKGAAQAGVKPKKDKMLPRGELMEMIEKVDGYIAEKTIDPICDQKVERHDLVLLKEVLQGVLAGERDPLAMLRTAKVSLDLWSIPDQLDVDEAEPEVFEDDEDTYDDAEYDPEAEGDIDVYDEDFAEDMDDTDNWD